MQKVLQVKAQNISGGPCGGQDDVETDSASKKHHRSEERQVIEAKKAGASLVCLG